MEEWMGEREKGIQLTKKKSSKSFLEYDLHSKARPCTMGVFTKNDPCMHLLFPIPTDQLVFLLEVNTSAP